MNDTLGKLGQSPRLSTIARSDGQWSPATAQRRATIMIALGIGFLALFSFLSIVLGTEDPRHADPRDDVRLWMRYGIR
jgi:hypothetical protein